MTPSWKGEERPGITHHDVSMKKEKDEEGEEEEEEEGKNELRL